jgi:hypothetical protein
MSLIDLHLPAGAVQRGELYASLDPALLKQDVFDIQLSCGAVIDVGWWPPRDKDGAFVVTVYEGSWENQLQPQTFVHELSELVELVQTLAAQYSGRKLPAVDANVENRPSSMHHPI